MKNIRIKNIVALLCVLGFILVLAACADKGGEDEVRYTIATKEEGIECILSNKDYFEKLNQVDLNIRMQKEYDMSKGLDEVMEFYAAQVLSFTDGESEVLRRTIERIEKTIREQGYGNIHMPDNIWFIKTTMAEEGGAGGYTHQTQIFLSEDLMAESVEKKDDKEYMDHFVQIIWHEIFHCLTRNDKEFKKTVYGVIDASVLEDEILFPKDISEKILSNPDVDAYDSYVPLTINGEKRDCIVFPYSTKPYEDGDSFPDAVEPMLYLVEPDGGLCHIDDASDFWDVFGRNTEYVIAIEEVMAENFSIAMTYDIEKAGEYGFESPEILEKIIAAMKN